MVAWAIGYVGMIRQGAKAKEGCAYLRLTLGYSRICPSARSYIPVLPAGIGLDCRGPVPTQELVTAFRKAGQSLRNVLR